jgi:hypothetical protein
MQIFPMRLLMTLDVVGARFKTGFAIEGDGAPGVFLAGQPSGIPDQNYAKTVSALRRQNYPEQLRRIPLRA